MMEEVKNGIFSPVILYEQKEPVEFSALSLLQYQDAVSVSYDSISALLEQYYSEKNTLTRIRQKSSDLRRLVQTALDRNRKKY